MKNKFLFTCGDINGIGPEISVKLFDYYFGTQSKSHLIFISPLNVFELYYKKLKCNFSFDVVDNITKTKPNQLNIVALPDSKIEIGKPTKLSGKVAYQSLERSIEILKHKNADAVITAPVSKYAFELAGINYPGQTEIFASHFNTKNYLMMFLSSKIIAALATIHIPIKEVSKNISRELLKNKIQILINTFKNDLKNSSPKVAVLGLNPHSGENGKIGREEIEIIIPSIKYFYKNVEGPFVPDAFFANYLYKNFDAVFGMYHDQVLIPFKMLNFNEGVNFTAGLPIIRTSPDHGTAFDIAGKGIADYKSLLAAFRYARIIALNRK